MRRLIVGSVATVLTVVGAGVVLIGQAPPAQACERVNEAGICLDVETPPTPPPDPDPGTDPVGGGGCRDQAGQSIPCVNSAGFVWIGSHNCYGFMLDPQPPAGDPMWKGNNSSEGSVWTCGDYTGVQQAWFLPGEAPVVDAGQLAEDLVKRAPFEVAGASIAPPPGYHTYLNYLNWMWVPEDQWHDVSVGVNAGGARVTLTAVPTAIEWDMGNGETKMCRDPGHAWVEGMPEDAPTSCGYTYTTMDDPAGDVRQVSAHFVYEVSWICVGRCSAPNGDLGEYPAPQSAPMAINVLQRQTVVIR
ncbi:MAG: hypothetical protein WKF79_03015 [Nocardioides sp.]